MNRAPQRAHRRGAKGVAAGLGGSVALHAAAFGLAAVCIAGRAVPGETAAPWQFELELGDGGSGAPAERGFDPGPLAPALTIVEAPGELSAPLDAVVTDASLAALPAPTEEVVSTGAIALAAHRATDPLRASFSRVGPLGGGRSSKGGSGGTAGGGGGSSTGTGGSGTGNGNGGSGVGRATEPPAAARLIDGTAPDYPTESRRLGEEGRAVVRIDVATDGRVACATLVESSGFDRLDRAALDGVRRWRFAPATQGGEPIAWSFLHRLEFRLQSSGAR
jgi:TonB family protein